MMSTMQRWGAACLWKATGRAAANRRALYGGATGLRILCFHETSPRELATLQRLVGWCRARFELASPADADDLLAGRWRTSGRDRVLLTFDDGLASNHAAAAWLAREGISATFFVIPSLLDRSMDEYLRHHERRGVKAHPPQGYAGARGLSRAQVREMAAMGHRIGAHNDGHRDLGAIHDEAGLRYEIGGALEGVAELTGAACHDFAIGFGQPDNVSDEAAAYLLARCPRVFACHRGLNVPGLTPRFLLRDTVEPEHPFVFTTACLEGAADHRLADRDRLMRRRVGALPAIPERAA